MSKAKDASSRLHEKHQLILADLLRDEDNKYCADCLAKGPRWASWNLGIFMCIRCAGIHRNLGVHISRVKSVNLDSWTPEQIESIQKGGNSHAKNLYEANLPANFRRPQDDYAVEQFIRAKYERKIYMARGEVATSKDQSAAVQEHKAKNKSKKAISSSLKSSAQTDQVLSVPRPSTGGRRSPSPQTSKSAPSSTKTSCSDLLALDSGPPPSSQRTTKKSSPQPVVDLLTGSTASSSASPTTNTTSSSSSSQPSDQFASATTSTAANEQQDLMFGTVAPGQQPLPQAPRQQQTAPANAKDSIMSLYGSKQQPHASYTAQGYPVNAYYYQQQQASAMHMAQVSAMQQHQVSQVTAQMQKIKMTQGGGAGGIGQPFPATMSNGGMAPIPTHPPQSTGVVMGGGQTLNPTLW